MQGRDRNVVLVSKVGDGGGTGGSSGVAGREGGREINCPAEDCTAKSWVSASLDELLLTRSSVGFLWFYFNLTFLISRKDQRSQLTAARIGREVSLNFALFLLATNHKN